MRPPAMPPPEGPASALAGSSASPGSARPGQPVWEQRGAQHRQRWVLPRKGEEAAEEALRWDFQPGSCPGTRTHQQLSQA